MANSVLKKRSIIGKTFQVGFLTGISRVLGLAREILQARFLGVGALSDAFIIAFKIPNSLRKIFAEGAVSAAFIPAFLELIKEDRKKINSLISLIFIFFEGLLILLCLCVFFYTESVISLLASGFSVEQMSYAVSFLRILMPFIILISSSAILGGVLQSVNHFFIPAAGPVILNIFFIGALIACVLFNLSVEFLCYAIMISGCFLFLLHLAAYFYFNFTFSRVTEDITPYFVRLLIKFFPVMISMSIMEINLAIDTWFSSFLQPGSLSLFTYAFRFMHIPLGVFGVAFSTILLPHFFRVIDYAPKRLNFYFIESLKFVFWVSMPIVIFMSVFSKQIFITTIALSGKFPLDRLGEVANLLIIFLIGLFFFSFNKILLNIYYAKRDTITPTIISALATISNLILNYILVIKFQNLGLASATVISGIMQTIILILILNKKYGIKLYFDRFLKFLTRYIFQLSVSILLFSLLYWSVSTCIGFLPQQFENTLKTTFLFWFWVGPLAAFIYFFMLKTKKFFKVKLYFLD